MFPRPELLGSGRASAEAPVLQKCPLFGATLPVRGLISCSIRDVVSVVNGMCGVFLVGNLTSRTVKLLEFS